MILIKTDKIFFLRTFMLKLISLLQNFREAFKQFTSDGYWRKQQSKKQMGTFPKFGDFFSLPFYKTITWKHLHLSNPEMCDWCNGYCFGTRNP